LSSWLSENSFRCILGSSRFSKCSLGSILGCSRLSKGSLCAVVGSWLSLLLSVYVPNILLSLGLLRVLLLSINVALILLSLGFLWIFDHGLARRCFRSFVGCLVEHKAEINHGLRVGL